MSLRKRGKFWHIAFTAPDGTRIRQSSRTTDRRAAEELEADLKARFWRQAKLGEHQAGWKEAVISWLGSTNHRDRAGVLEKLRWLDPHLGALPVRDITRDTLHRLRASKLAEGVKPATTNRYMAVVSAVLHHAHDRGWIESVPRLRKLDEPKGKIHWLTGKEARDLVDHLRSRPRCGHIADMVEFTLATGLREANVTGLEWSRIDLDSRLAWIPPEQSKSNATIRIPLNDLALAVLQRREGQHERWVFTYRRRKVRKAGHDGFRQSVAALGLDNVTWHTLRHTWASWHAMAGTPLQVIMELGGWTSMQMVLRYAHLAPDHLSSFAENVTQNWHNAEKQKG